MQPIQMPTVIFPYYPPPVTGKVNDLLGSELNSLYTNSGTLTDTAQNIFLISHDSVMIEVIAKSWPGCPINNIAAGYWLWAHQLN